MLLADSIDLYTVSLVYINYVLLIAFYSSYIQSQHYVACIMLCGSYIDFFFQMNSNSLLVHRRLLHNALSGCSESARASQAQFMGWVIEILSIPRLFDRLLLWHLGECRQSA